MKNKVLHFFGICLLFLSFPNLIYAHPGRTDSNGCHTCKTNCEKWGLTQGQYHCHNGNTSNEASLTTGSSKSDDNTLKSITIDGENIKISDVMNYETKKEKIDILVETNNSKATYIIDNNTLDIGINTINIKVTAENGNTKNYSILVNREKLSNNTNIKIIVDDEVISFVSGKANINVSSETNNLNYSYVLENENSSVVVDGDKNLKFGENIIVFSVTAEDGTEAKYELIVNRYTNDKETTSTIFGLIILGGMGYGIYYLIKKKKNK